MGGYAGSPSPIRLRDFGDAPAAVAGEGLIFVNDAPDSDEELFVDGPSGAPLQLTDGNMTTLNVPAAGGVGGSGTANRLAMWTAADTIGDATAGAEFAGGLASDPGLVPQGDPDTGIFSSSPNILGFSAGGFERLRLSTAVEIPTDVPLHLQNSADPQLRLDGQTASMHVSAFWQISGATKAEITWEDNNSEFILGTSSTDNLSIRTDNSNRLTIDGSGNITQLGGQYRLPDGTAATPSGSFNLDQDTGIYKAGDNVFGIAAGGAQRILASSTGVVISGTTELGGVGYTWPGADGVASSILSTNGSGTLSWTTTPAITDFSSATHNHENAAGGGTISIVNATTGTLTVARGGTGTTTSTGTGSVVLDTSPTIVTPTIASFANAGHNHEDAAGGGTISILNATTGTLSIGRGGTGQTTATAAFDALASSTTKGDIIVHNGTSNIRLAVGADNQVLTADSAEASGVKWAAAAFTGLSDTPANFTGAASQVVRVNSGETALEFASELTITASAITAGVQLLASGTGLVGSPSLSFSGDPDTGIFQPAANTIGFSNAGSESARFLSGGELALGTTSLNNAADVANFEKNQNAVTALKVINDTGGTAARASFQAIQFDGGNFVTAVVDSVSDSFTTSGALVPGAVVFLGGGNNIQQVNFGSRVNVPSTFWSNDTEIMRMDTTGLSIGTAAAPSFALDVQDDAAVVGRFRRDGVGDATILNLDNFNGGASDGTQIDFRMHDSGGAETIFGRIHSSIEDDTGGSEEGEFRFHTMEDSTLTIMARLQASNLNTNDQTCLTLRLNDGGVRATRTVKLGADDSGGSGLKALVVDN